MQFPCGLDDLVFLGGPFLRHFRNVNPQGPSMRQYIPKVLQIPYRRINGRSIRGLAGLFPVFGPSSHALLFESKT